MFNENVSQKTLAVLLTNILYSDVSQSVNYKNSWNSDSKGTEDMQEYAKNFARWVLSTFWRVFARKYIFLDLEAAPRNRPKFWKKVYHEVSLPIFCMNNKTFIEFVFIMDINRPFYSYASLWMNERLRLTLFWYKPLSFSCGNHA